MSGPASLRAPCSCQLLGWLFSAGVGLLRAGGSGTQDAATSPRPTVEALHSLLPHGGHSLAGTAPPCATADPRGESERG